MGEHSQVVDVTVIMLNLEVAHGNSVLEAREHDIYLIASARYEDAVGICGNPRPGLPESQPPSLYHCPLWR